MESVIGKRPLYSPNVPPAPHNNRKAEQSRHHAENDPELVRDALRYIPADNYDIWFIIVCAIKSAWNNEVGFQLLHEWSKTSEKYIDEEDCRKQWDACNGGGDEPITLGSLFHYAKEGGWIAPTLEPMPLRRPLPPETPFPIEALGKTLGDAALAIHDIVQALPLPSAGNQYCRRRL